MDLEQLLRELGYTDEWLALGIVDEIFLRLQYAEYCASEDKNQEHYRAHAFWLFLVRTPNLSDALIDRLFLLTDDGPDGCDLGEGRILEVITCRHLTDDQLFGLAERHPRVLERPFQKQYIRECLLRKIRRSGLAAHFDLVKQQADSHVQLAMLDHPELEEEHVAWLAEAGSNKAIRNRAAELLRSRRFSRRG